MDIVVIPDTQVRKGTPTEHIEAMGKYLLAERPEVVVCIGDWWDMPALNFYGTKLDMENLRLVDDLEAGCAAMDLLFKAMDEYNLKQRRNNHKQYKPRLVFTIGNHEPHVRVLRIFEDQPHLKGCIRLPKLENWGWEVHEFLKPVVIEDIRFCHYFKNTHSAKKNPIGGMPDTMLKNLGFSFVQGHTQGFKMAKHYLGDGTERIGIVAGSFYTHDEKYMGNQGNEHHRGFVHLRDVKSGGANVAEYSIEWLLKHYG